MNTHRPKLPSPGCLFNAVCNTLTVLRWQLLQIQQRMTLLAQVQPWHALLPAAPTRNHKSKPYP